MRRTAVAPDDGWESEASSGFAVAGFLTLVFVAFTLLAMGPMIRFDAYFNLDGPPQEWRPVLHVLDRIGQRAVALPILAAVVYRVARRNRSWRPVVLSVGSVLALNFVVGVLKLGFARNWPRETDPSFFGAGMAYPSGHAANIVLVYGLLCYLAMHYGNPGPRMRAFLWALVPVLGFVMCFTSVTLNWHWLTDLLGGLLVGGIVLQLSVAMDRVVPEEAFVESPFRWNGTKVG